jgi:hypothetical protein
MLILLGFLFYYSLYLFFGNYPLHWTWGWVLIKLTKFTFHKLIKVRTSFISTFSSLLFLCIRSGGHIAF